MQALASLPLRTLRHLRVTVPSRLILLLALLPLIGPAAQPAHAAVVNLSVTAVPQTFEEGVPFNGRVGSFPDPGAGPYTALINWGDGVTSNGGFSSSCAGSVC